MSDKCNPAGVHCLTHTQEYKDCLITALRTRLSEAEAERDRLKALAQLFEGQGNAEIRKRDEAERAYWKLVEKVRHGIRERENLFDMALNDLHALLPTQEKKSQEKPE